MTNELKTIFPIFKNRQKLVYLDNAATTQICPEALQEIEEFYKKYRSNIHRGSYEIAEEATSAYEGSRGIVADFINAEKDEIVFTSGTTHGLNLLAYSLAPRLTHRDNVVLSKLEHHSNIVPWQQMSKHYGFEIRYIDLDKKNFNLDTNSAEKIIDQNTKIISFSLVSNVLGCITPAEKIIGLAKKVKATVILDAAQAIAHIPIDVKKLSCDFLVFSGHKMYGPNGIGVLYGKKEMLEEQLEPFFFGGDMVSSVNLNSATWNEVPHRFEAGTPNISEAIGLGAAIRFIKQTGWKKIMEHEKELTAYALKKMENEVKIIGPAGTDNRVGVISFALPDTHPHDVAEIMSGENVAIRAGFHCAEPLHKEYDLPGTARLSLGIYNDKNDIDEFITAIKKVRKIFVHVR